MIEDDRTQLDARSSDTHYGDRAPDDAPPGDNGVLLAEQPKACITCGLRTT
jgi:hypothetical protein